MRGIMADSSTPFIELFLVSIQRVGRWKKLGPAPPGADCGVGYECLVLLIESIRYSNPTHWSASSFEPPRNRRGGLSTSTTKFDAMHKLRAFIESPG